MQIIHKLGTRSISKKTDDETYFLLTNKRLGYAYLPNKTTSGRESRYMGVFFPYKNSLYRVVAELCVDKNTYVRKVVNKFYNVERYITGNKEIFFMPLYLNSIVYRLNRSDLVRISLDIRPSYEPFAFGRFYKITKKDDKILVEYTKKDNDRTEYKLYVAIKPENLDYKEILRWKPVYYALDFERNSSPAEMNIYELIKVNSKKIVISFSQNKEDALKEADYVSENLRELEKKRRNYIKKIIRDEEVEKKLIGRGPKRKEIYFAYNACKISLDQFVTEEGIYAGLPWFFQIWSRDELISLKNIPFKEKRGIIFRDLNNIQEDGRIPNIIDLNNYYDNICTTNADSIGWLFKRIDESINEFYLEEKGFILDKLIESVCRMNENYIDGDLIINKSKETWMDTIFGDNGRLGKRIEIQAMLLNIYHLAYRLTKHTKYDDVSNAFRFLEESMLKKVREEFWNGKVLADGLDDFTIRPNIFIAAYIYPDILSKEEWIKCFENSLPALWLKWGGISTIDKESDLFTEKHTGERIQSYHRGDSWYFMNNLAALILYRMDKKKFRRYIERILKASTEEILWKGMIGHHSELSSAIRGESNGCGAQAWSNAMYIELINEIYKK